MIAWQSGSGAAAFAAAGGEPVGGREVGGLAGFHGGQTGEDVFKVFPRVEAKAAAVLDEGVEDGGFFSGVLAADEEPIFGSELGAPDGVLNEDMPPPDLCRVHKLEAHVRVMFYAEPYSHAA